MKVVVRSFPLLLLIIASSVDVSACTACFGQSDDALAKGMNMGIFALLLVIGCVLATVASFFVFLARRSNHLEAIQNAGGNNQLSQTSTNG